jgi:ABC-2 type transport system permease protein
MADTGRWPSPARLVVGQIRYQNRLFWRSPISAIFTLAFPLIFLVLFGVIFSGEEIEREGGVLTVAQFYAPSLGVFAAASATYTNIGINQSLLRDAGVLRRVRGTPLPPWTYLAGVVGSAVWVAAIGVVVMLGVGVVVYDLEVEAAKMPAAVVTFVIGTAAFAALGLALSALARTGSSAPAVAQATLLPMAFVSDIFIPLSDPPRWLETIGDVLPLKPFVLSFQEAFSPFTEAPAFLPGRLVVVALWGVLGALVAARRFTWEPRVES